MKQFIGVVHQEGDSAFGVSFPDVPGCFSAADDLEDLVSEATDALHLWFEDMPLVEPRPLDAVRAAAAEDLADGAFLVAVPFIVDDAEAVRVHISLERGVRDAVDAAARARGLTRSAFLAEAARNEIEGRR